MIGGGTYIQCGVDIQSVRWTTQSMEIHPLTIGENVLVSALSVVEPEAHFIGSSSVVAQQTCVRAPLASNSTLSGSPSQAVSVGKPCYGGWPGWSAGQPACQQLLGVLLLGYELMLTAIWGTIIIIIIAAVADAEPLYTLLFLALPFAKCDDFPSPVHPVWRAAPLPFPS